MHIITQYLTSDLTRAEGGWEKVPEVQHSQWWPTESTGVGVPGDEEQSG